mmetsp:Transcript_2113/g.5708  ORF Transcript_2113/g.5708 Transcript_2113/m.5708 type:complete len:81 (+) Transcript_2113:55-297(+)
MPRQADKMTCHRTRPVRQAHRSDMGDGNYLPFVLSPLSRGFSSLANDQCPAAFTWLWRSIRDGFHSLWVWGSEKGPRSST